VPKQNVVGLPGPFHITQFDMPIEGEGYGTLEVECRIGQFVGTENIEVRKRAMDRLYALWSALLAASEVMKGADPCQFPISEQCSMETPEQERPT
jgi:hypothetical protein